MHFCYQFPLINKSPSPSQWLCCCDVMEDRYFSWQAGKMKAGKLMRNISKTGNTETQYLKDTERLLPAFHLLITNSFCLCPSLEVVSMQLVNF